jgi:mannose-6-phosphate isomerase-like protein (cupin superfamily)
MPYDLSSKGTARWRLHLVPLGNLSRSVSPAIMRPNARANELAEDWATIHTCQKVSSEGGKAVAWADTSLSMRFSAERFQKVNLFETERMFCDIYCFEPGQEQTAHKHQGADKIYYIIEGIALVQIGAERRELFPGMAAHAGAGEEHAVTNVGTDRLVMLVFMAPHP